MKKLLIIALVIVAMTSCKEKEPQTINGNEYIVDDYIVKLETPDGQSLFNTSTQGYINLFDVRIEHINSDGILETYQCDNSNIFGRLYGVETNSNNIPIYNGDKKMAIVDVIFPTHKAKPLDDLAVGKTFTLNYIHWSETMVDKVEVIMEKLYGEYNDIIVVPYEIKINDKIVYSRTKNERSTITFKKIVGGSDSSYTLE